MKLGGVHLGTFNGKRYRVGGNSVGCDTRIGDRPRKWKSCMSVDRPTARSRVHK
jgi:hypothetical protein